MYGHDLCAACENWNKHNPDNLVDSCHYPLDPCPYLKEQKIDLDKVIEKLRSKYARDKNNRKKNRAGSKRGH